MESSSNTVPKVRLIELTQNSPPETTAAARELLLEYGRFVLDHADPAQFCFGNLEKEAAALPASYIDQGGGCVAAFLDETPAGFVAWRTLRPTVAPDAWEMKRLWVRPIARGHALGRVLTLAVLDRARAARRSAVYLDTIPAAMSKAHRLYLELGFLPCAPYNNNPISGVTHLRIELGSPNQ